MNQEKILLVEDGCIQKVGETLRTGQITGKLLYVSDSVVDSLFGAIVHRQLEEIGFVESQTITQNTISCAVSIAESIIAADIDCIIGMGGGKVLDVCKYAAFISKVPFLSIPTTLANDGIASPIAVLKSQDGRPKSLGCVPPAMLLLDTELILKCPPQLIKAGIGDTISNYMALLDWNLACARGMEKPNGYAYLMSQASLDGLMNTQYSSICSGFVKVLADSLVMSGIAMDFAGSSRPVSGSEHLFSHALDYYCKISNFHGIQVALGTVAVLKLAGMDYSRPLRYLRLFEVDINPMRIGIDRETFVFCMQKATFMRKNRYTYLHELDLSDTVLGKLYHELMEEL